MSGFLKKIDVLVLCGGMGTRLKSVLPDRPKIMAEFNGRPFLAILLDDLRNQGFKRVILAIGYKAEIVEEYCQDNSFGLDICFSKEVEPLGTGGALMRARGLLQSDPFFVLNGDSFCAPDFNAACESHLKRDGLITMVLSKASDVSDYGRVAVDQNGVILSFQEKVEGPAATYAVNAGIYVMSRKIFSLLPKAEKFSLERDYFAILKKGDAFSFMTDASFIDIGTPERYTRAQEFLGKD